MPNADSPFHGIIEVQEVGYKKVNELMTEGYEILAIHPGSRLIKSNPEDTTSVTYVRRRPVYVMGKREPDDE